MRVVSLHQIGHIHFGQSEHFWLIAALCALIAGLTAFLLWAGIWGGFESAAGRPFVL